MIASLDGTVAAIAVDSLVVEVGGVGYRVYAAPSVVASAAPGSRLKLFTHHVVREDAQQLFGFKTAEELGFFGLLLTVTGVGPKVAMAIAGSRPAAELQLAIMQQDQAVLVSIPGIGKRLAERVIFELKEKVTAAGAAFIAIAGSRRRERRHRALRTRLFARRPARRAHRLGAAGAGASLEERVKAALRVLARD